MKYHHTTYLLAHALLFTIVTMLLPTTCAYAQQNWQPLGPNDPGKLAYNFADYTSMASAPDGTLYVAFSEYGITNPGTLLVKKLVGSNWETVGTPNFASAYNIQLAVDYNNTPYVAFINVAKNYTLSVMYLQNNNWVYAGSPSLTPDENHQPDNISLSVSADNEIYLANDNLYPPNEGSLVRKFNGVDWDTVGSTIFDNGGSIKDMDISAEDILYVAGNPKDLIYNATVQKFNGVNWEIVGDNGALGDIFTSIEAIAIAPDGTPYVAETQPGSTEYTRKHLVQKFNGIYWEALPDSGLTTSGQKNWGMGNVDFKIAEDGNPYIAYRDSSGQGLVKKFNGIYWETLGNESFSTSQTSDINLVIKKDGSVHVAYAIEFIQKLATVKKFDGVSWKTEDVDGITNRSDSYEIIRTDETGTPYIAFLEQTYPDNLIYWSSQISVMKFTAGQWQYVGKPGFSGSTEQIIGFDIAPDGSLYVVYTDYYDGEGKLMKYNGTDWEMLGDISVNSTGTNDLNMAIAPDGTIYITHISYTGALSVTKYKSGTFEDMNMNIYLESFIGNDIAIGKDGFPFIASSSSKSDLTVIKYNGSKWIYVGTNKFASGFSLNIAIDPENNPSIFFKSTRLGNQGIVMKYDGTEWDTTSIFYSAGIREWGRNKFVIDDLGKQYVAISDSTQDYKATVLTKDDNTWLPLGEPGFTAWAKLPAIAVSSTGNVLAVYTCPNLFVKAYTTGVLASALFNFEASLTTETITNLSWKTGDEINLEDFIVERSTNAKDYYNIGIVSAKGPNTTYTFFDQKPFIGYNYYRLKIMSKDRSFTYSNIETIYNGKDFSVNVYPNPVYKKIPATLLVTGSEGLLHITVRNMNGNVVWQNVYLGDNNISIPMQNMPGGVYIISVKDNFHSKAIKVMKQ